MSATRRAVAVALPVAASLATPAIAQGRRRLTMVMSWPHNFPGLASIASGFARSLETITEGKLTVRVHAAGELVGPFEVFDAVAQRSADLYHSTPTYLVSKWQAASFFGFVPFGLTVAEHCGWMYFGGGQELQHRIWRKRFGLVPFTCGQTGIQMAGWFTREIRNLDDFRGIKMRIVGLAGEVMRRVGAAAVTVPPQEIFAAFRAGTIDATELCCAWLDAANGFHQVARYYYTPGWQEVNSTGEIGMNAALFDELSPAMRGAVEICARAVNAVNIGEWPYHNARALRALEREHGVQVRSFPDDVVAALARASAEVVARIGGSDEDAREVYASWKAVRDEAMAYSVKVELPMYHARRIALEAGA